MAGNLHPNSDINDLYVCRCNGGRGIKQILTLYAIRIIAVRQHLLRNKDQNNLIRYIRRRYNQSWERTTGLTTHC